MQTQNLDIAGLINRSRRFKFEWAKSASGNVSHVSIHDANRLRSYLKSMAAYIDFFQMQPQLDVPEYHGGRVIELGDGPTIQKVENESVNDLIELWTLLETELVNCQSSRLAVRLIDPDLLRVNAILEKMSNFLEQYMINILPLDLPESSPMRDGVGAGRTGIGSN